MLVLCIEAYLMGVVWTCYKYMVTLRITNGNSMDLSTNLITAFFLRFNQQSVSRNGRRRGNNGRNRDAELETGNDVVEADDVLPQYEDTVKTPASKFMPPAYIGQAGSSEKKGSPPPSG